MAKQSAGLLLYKQTGEEIKVLLVHPGGPFWGKKDKGAWSIPKGEFTEDEEAKAAAKREFKEELGLEPPEGEMMELGQAKQSNKVVHAWAIEADLDVTRITSNKIEIEWPPKSGKKQNFPEVDKARWFRLGQAAEKVVKGQMPLLEKLANNLGTNMDPPKQQEQTSLL